MLLDLNKIRSPRKRHDEVYAPGAFAADDSFRVVEPVALGFDVFKDKETFRLTGGVKTTLELPCSRCLEPFVLPVDAAFDLRFQPLAAVHAVKGEEVEIQEDDLATAFYEHDQIDLGQLMREQFLLALPMKPLCSVACHGLCATCGANLNRSTCDCKRDWDDPRLAVLRELRAKK